MAIAWSQVVALVIGVLILFPDAGALQIAWLRVASVACGVLVAIWMVRGVLPGLRNRDVAANAYRPILASVLMAITLYMLADVVRLPVLPMFLIKVIVGAVVYVLAMVVLWRLSGRPVGAETYIIDKIGSFWSSRRRVSTGEPR